MKNSVQISVAAIGRNLKLLRTSFDVNQFEMAESLGVSRSSYAQYELGNRIPDAYVLYEIALLFEIDMEILFEADQAKFLGGIVGAFTKGGEGKRMMENYRRLSPFSKGRVLEFSEKLLEEDKQKENNMQMLKERCKAK